MNNIKEKKSQLGQQPLVDMEQQIPEETGMLRSMNNISEASELSSVRSLPQVSEIEQLGKFIETNGVQQPTDDITDLTIPETQTNEELGDFSNYIKLRKKMMGF